MTRHWIDRSCRLRKALIEFRRFQTTHTGDAASAFLKDVFTDWEVVKDIKCPNRQQQRHDFWDELAMLVPERRMSMILSKCSGISLRCIAHVINLSFKDFMSNVRPQTSKIISVINALRFLVKLCDLYRIFCGELNMKAGLPNLDCKTR